MRVDTPIDEAVASALVSEVELSPAERQGSARQTYRQSAANGKPLTGVELGRIFQRSDRWGAQRIAEVRVEDAERYRFAGDETASELSASTGGADRSSNGNGRKPKRRKGTEPAAAGSTGPSLPIRSEAAGDDADESGRLGTGSALPDPAEALPIRSNGDSDHRPNTLQIGNHIGSQAGSTGHNDAAPQSPFDPIRRSGASPKSGVVGNDRHAADALEDAGHARRPVRVGIPTAGDRTGNGTHPKPSAPRNGQQLKGAEDDPSHDSGRPADPEAEVVPISPWVRGITLLAVVAVALAAAASSYEHLHNVATLAGAGNQAWRLPVSVDGLMVASSMCLYQASKAKQSAGVVAPTSFALGLIASIAGNVIAVNPALIDLAVIKVAVAAEPPVALALAHKLLLQLISRKGGRA